jgi:subtilisin family serine protease
MPARPCSNRSRRPARRRALAAGALIAVLAGTLTGTAPRPAAAAPAYLGDQWGLSLINATAAWASGTGTSVRIGIVDTGVDPNQQDLAGKIVASADCTSANGNPAACTAGGTDDEGHGTHVAGIAGARGIGVSGVAHNASFVVAKVLDSSGSGSIANVGAGILWAVSEGARVVNLSLGADAGTLGINCVLGGCDQSGLTPAIQAAWNAGAIPVIAAGNNAGALFGPAGYGGLPAVVVAASNKDGVFESSYSSTPGNATWGVLAPGGDPNSGPACGQFDPTEILSTYWTAANPTSCYATDAGTSMATPFVTGTLALLLGRGLSRDQAVQALMSSLNHNYGCGAGAGCQGLLDAGAAMAAANHMLPPPAAASPPPASAAHSAGVTTTAGGHTIGPSGAAGSTTTSGPTSTTGAAAGSTTGRVRTAARHQPGSGNGWVLPLLVVAGVALAAILVERARRRAQLTRARAVTVEAHPPSEPASTGSPGTTGTGRS